MFHRCNACSGLDIKTCICFLLDLLFFNTHLVGLGREDRVLTRRLLDGCCIHVLHGSIPVRVQRGNGQQEMASRGKVM